MANGLPDRPTVRTVAQAAGVSPSLVSFTFNGRPGVAPQTRERILAVAAELGYQPDQRARELRLGRSDTVGLVIRNAANPFFNQLLMGMQEEAQADSVSVLAVDSRYDPEREGELVRSLAARSPMGLALLPTGDAGVVRLWHRLAPGVPVVIVNSQHAAMPEVPHVGPDDVRAVRLAFDHLWGLGHRRIGLLSAPAAVMPDGDRTAEYQRLCASHEIAPRLIQADLRGEGLAAAVRAALAGPRPPTAIITNSDHAAVHVYRAVLERGWRIGREVSVVGHDDQPTSALLAPGLTTIRVDTRELGRQAYRRLRDPELPDYVAPVELVVRGSTVPGKGEVQR